MSGPRIIPCRQGTDEWFRARLAVPTASQFQCLLAQGRGGGESKTRRTYLLKLACEAVTGEPQEAFSNGDTERGHYYESDARDRYVMRTDAECEEVGFIVNRDGTAGGSPDSLVGRDGVLEIKTKRAHLLAEILLGDAKALEEHKAQCQGLLWVAEREWCDLVVYWPKMPLFVHRWHRDEAYIKRLAECVERFREDLDATVAQLRGRGTAHLRERLERSADAAALEQCTIWAG